MRSYYENERYTLAELMVKTDPKLYRKYLSDEKGKKVLYLRLRKALYRMMKSALLFYRKLVSELNQWVSDSTLTTPASNTPESVTGQFKRRNCASHPHIFPGQMKGQTKQGRGWG